jgi:hypothetical protein
MPSQFRSVTQLRNSPEIPAIFLPNVISSLVDHSLMTARAASAHSDGGRRGVGTHEHVTQAYQTTNPKHFNATVLGTSSYFPSALLVLQLSI